MTLVTRVESNNQPLCYEIGHSAYTSPAHGRAFAKACIAGAACRAHTRKVNINQSQTLLRHTASELNISPGSNLHLAYRGQRFPLGRNCLQQAAHACEFDMRTNVRAVRLAAAGGEILTIPFALQ